MKRRLTSVLVLAGVLAWNVDGVGASENPAGCKRLDVYFGFGSATIVDPLPIIRYANMHHGSRFVLYGYADKWGRREFNLKLAQKRIDAVRKILEQAGVQRRQIVGISRGEEYPFARQPNPSKENLEQSKNRRVEICALSQ